MLSDPMLLISRDKRKPEPSCPGSQSPILETLDGVLAELRPEDQDQDTSSGREPREAAQLQPWKAC